MSTQPQFYLPKNALVKLLGISWGLLPIAYMLPMGPNALHGFHIALYIAIFALSKQKHLPIQSVQLFGIALIFVAQSLFLDAFTQAAALEYVALLMFALNLGGLIAISDRQTLPQFCANFFIASSACALLHIALATSGQIIEIGGRFKFLANQHPNLGGEIFAIAAFAGAISMKKNAFFLLCLPILASTLLMETRTGTLVVVLLMFMKLVFEAHGRFSLRSAMIGAGFGLGIVILVVAEGTLPRLIALDILLVEDIQRGASTGLLSGRDTQWAAAWGYFAQKPLFGHGLSLYANGVRGAHNPLLYSLSIFGIVGLIFWLWLLPSLIALARKDLRIFLYLLPPSIMLVINDRFLNSNSFPLLFYFFIIQLGNFAPNNWPLQSAWPKAFEAYAFRLSDQRRKMWRPSDL